MNRERLGNERMDQDQPIEWLLDCLRPGTADEKSAQLGRLSESDWSQVFDVAMRHAVAPLLYDRLKPLASGCNVPLDVLQKLRGVYLANAARNMKIYHELGEVLTALQQAGIPVIVLKGAHLAELVYGNIALRIMGDLDLLVPTPDFVKARKTLITLGYDSGSPFDFEALCMKDKSQDLRHPHGKAQVELHWTIEHPSHGLAVDVAGLWERAEPATLGGVATLTLSPADLLSHLCLEATYHHGGVFDMGLRPFCDIATSVLHYQTRLEWNLVQCQAQAWAAAKYVYLALRWASGLLGAPVPEQLLGSLKPNEFDAKWEALAWEQLHSKRDAAAHERMASWNREYGSANIAQMLGPKPLLSKLGILLRVLFPSPGAMRGIYGLPFRSTRVYFCYLLRPCFLVRKYLPIAWGFVRREKKRTLHDASEIRRPIELREWLRK